MHDSFVLFVCKLFVKVNRHDTRVAKLRQMFEMRGIILEEDKKNWAEIPLYLV